MPPRKKRITTEEFLEEEPARELPIDPRIGVDDETLDYALKQFDDRGGLELKYYLTQPGGSAFIGGYPDIIPESQLQDWYPQGGKFEVRIYVHGEFRDRRFMMIAPRPGGMTGGQGDSGIVGLLKEQIQMLRDEIRSRPNHAPQSSALELAQAVAAMQQLNGGGNKNDSVETVRLAMELAKMIKGVPETDDSFMGVVKDVVKESGPGLLQAFMAGSKNPSMMPPTGLQTPVLPASPEEQITASMKAGIDFLKKKALAGADVGLYIDMAVDNRELETFAPILHAILTQQFEVFASVDPEIGKPPYAEFFRAFYDGLRSAFSPTDSVVELGSGKAGNVADVRDHAKPGKAGSK
jgi:hypothetical protein